MPLPALRLVPPPAMPVEPASQTLVAVAPFCRGSLALSSVRGMLSPVVVQCEMSREPTNETCCRQCRFRLTHCVAACVSVLACRHQRRFYLPACVAIVAARIGSQHLAAHLPPLGQCAPSWHGPRLAFLPAPRPPAGCPRPCREGRPSPLWRLPNR